MNSRMRRRHYANGSHAKYMALSLRRCGSKLTHSFIVYCLLSCDIYIYIYIYIYSMRISHVTVMRWMVTSKITRNYFCTISCECPIILSTRALRGKSSLSASRSGCTHHERTCAGAANALTNWASHVDVEVCFTLILFPNLFVLFDF